MIKTTELRESLDKPGIEIDGVEYVGRLLSWPQSLGVFPKPFAWAEAACPVCAHKPDPVSDEQVQKDVRELLGLLDMKSADGVALPVEKFLALERPIFLEALTDFFRCLRQSLPKQGDGGKSSTSETEG